MSTQTNKPKLSVPSVHLNGTSGEELLDQIVTAANAIRDALAALQAASPNARDYYVQSADAFKTAIAGHTARLGKLQEVLSELEEIGMEISDRITPGSPA